MSGAVKPVRWGILGTANIALKKAVPGMKESALVDVVAIASRDESKARAAANRLGIPRAYGSYEALLADPEIEAIYNPLPNHLHVPWTIRAAEAGKHVLCEKPIALNADEARQLLAVRERTGVQIGEAFMVRSHPQWLGAKEIIDSGRIGELRAIAGHFSYNNQDASNVRNIREIGGGGLLDIGCYPITISRWLFGAEPEAVVALMERDPTSGIDRLVSGMMRFATGQARCVSCAMPAATRTCLCWALRRAYARAFAAVSTAGPTISRADSSAPRRPWRPPTRPHRPIGFRSWNRRSAPVT